MSLGVPQAVRLFRTRDTEGLSVFFWQLNLCVNVIWTVHGALIGQVNMIVPNGISMFVTLFVIYLLHRTRKLSYLYLLAPGLIAAACFIAIDVFIGTFWFGYASAIPALVSNGGATVELIRSRKITGVSPVWLAAYNLNQFFWVTWGYLVADDGTIICSWATWIVVGLNSIWLIMRKCGLPPIKPEPLDVD